jgi:L-ascorbate metabolism protein UlaG (beta-lactamase superfamily)
MGATGTASPGSPGHVTLTYLGAAGWRLDDDSHVLLVDPYFSRRNVEDTGSSLTPDEAAIARYCPHVADAILVGHSHYDHLLDVPDVAKLTGALVIGTESTLNLVRAARVPEERLFLAHAGESFSVGPFAVHPLRGLHSLTGQTNIGANIPRDVALPLTADGYGEGGTLQYLVHVAGRSILFIGSANFVENELRGLHPDIAIVAVALREKVPDYSCRLVRALGNPALVLANHFDAHWEPLGPRQMDLDDEARASLAKFAAEVASCAPTTRVVVPVHLQPMPI